MAGSIEESTIDQTALATVKSIGRRFFLKLDSISKLKFFTKDVVLAVATLVLNPDDEDPDYRMALKTHLSICPSKGYRIDVSFHSDCKLLVPAIDCSCSIDIVKADKTKYNIFSKSYLSTNIIKDFEIQAQDAPGIYLSQLREGDLILDDTLTLAINVQLTYWIRYNDVKLKKEQEQQICHQQADSVEAKKSDSKDTLSKNDGSLDGHKAEITKEFAFFLDKALVLDLFDHLSLPGGFEEKGRIEQFFGHNKRCKSLMSQRLNNKKFADVIFKSSNGTLLYGHKFILVGVSEKLTSLIENASNSNNFALVNLPRFNHLTLLKVLGSIYLSPLSDWCFDLELLEAAIELEIDYLIAECLTFVPDLLSVENVAEAIAVGFKFDLKKPYDICIDFLAKHLHEVEASKGWKEKIGSNLPLMEKIYREIGEKKP